MIHPLQPVSKANSAIASNGARTIYGYLHPEDVRLLSAKYPVVPDTVISALAAAINHPRLLEVAGIAEMLHRYLSRSFSKLKGIAVNLAANPLSILYLSEGQVRRVKTGETELLHGSMEKLALRTGSVEKINRILDEAFGLQLIFGCSCCVIVTATKDRDAVLGSEYYRKREGFGRFYDSDVLTASGNLLSADSLTSVPAEVFAASADFKQPEIESYLRFARITGEIIVENPWQPDLAPTAEVVEFFRQAA